MKKFFFLLLFSGVGFFVKAQTNPFPSLDSLERFINRYIRNSPVEAFQNLRLNTAMIGMLRFQQNSEIGSGVDTMYKLNDSTVRLITHAPDTFDVTLRFAGGGGGANSNVGSGYRWVVVGTQNIKSVVAGYGQLIDSTTNANALTFKADTTGSNGLVTRSELRDSTDLTTQVQAPIFVKLRSSWPVPDTLAIDTTIMQTRATGIKVSDSVAANRVKYSDTAAMLSPYPRGSGASGRIAYWNDSRLITSDDRNTFNATTNEQTVDSLTAIRARADSLLLNPYRIIRLADSLVTFGNSITEGSAASPIGDSAYVPRLGRYLNLTTTNRGQSGAGIKTPQTRHYTYINPGHNAMTTLMIGFNDLHSNDINGATGFKTRAMLYNGLNVIFMNHFAKSMVSVSDASVTKFGSWNNNYTDSRNGQKGFCSYTSTQNDSLTYTFTDSTVFFSAIGGDGSAGASIGSTVDVYIDNVLVKSFTTNNQADNVLSLSPDNAAGGRERGPMGVIFSGLTYASHKIKVVKTGATGFLVANYFGHLRDARTAPPFVLFDIPWMKAAGYAPGNSSTVKTDLINSKYDSVRATWPAAYPVYAVQTNNFYDTATGTSGDNIHPNNTGHRQIFNAAEDVLPSIFKTANRPGMIFSTGADFWGVTDSAGRKKFIMENIFWPDTLNNVRNRSLTQTIQTGGFNLSNQSRISNQLILRGVTLGHNLNDGLDSSAYFGENTSGRPAWGFNFRSGTTDNKRSGVFAETTGGPSIIWRLINDANSAANEYLRVYRNGIIPDSIVFKTNTLRVYNVPSAGLQNRLSLSIGSDGKAGVGVRVPLYKWHVLDSATSQTASGRAGSFEYTGATFNTNSGDLTADAGYFVANATRGSGSNNLINRGIYSSAAGAQLNYAAIFDAGNVGIGITAPTFKLHLSGTMGAVKSGIPLQTTNGTRQMVTYDTASGQFERMDIPAGGGGSDGNGIYSGSGSVSGTVNVSGGGSASLNLGTSGSKLAFLGANSSGSITLTASNYVQLFGGIQLSTQNAGDANFTASDNVGVIHLGQITANRDFTPPAQGDGKLIIIHNRNSSGNTWNVTGNMVTAAGVAITSLVNGTMYIFLSDGTNFVQVK